MLSSRGFCGSCTLLLAVVGVTACGPTLSSGSPRTADARPVALDVSTRMIGSRALQSQSWRPLTDVITFFWPNVESPPWMSTSATLRGFDRLGVYANGALIGSLDALRDVPASRIARVRRISPVEEQQEFGRMHAAGAVVVEWQRDRR
jgi:hypothetical protein